MTTPKEPSAHSHKDTQISERTEDDQRDITYVAGIPVDSYAFAKLEPEVALSIADFIFRERGDPGIVGFLEELSPHLTPAALKTHLCQTPVVEFLWDAGLIKEWPRQYYLRLEEILFYLDSELSFDIKLCPNFTITYQTSGNDAVPAADIGGPIIEPGSNKVIGQLAAGNGIPDYIERLCFWLERALAIYTSSAVGFKNPAQSGPVQVLVSRNHTFANPGGITMARDLSPNVLAGAACHELMHSCQYLYQSTGRGLAAPWRWGMMEGGANLSEDFVSDDQNVYIWWATALGASPLNEPWSSSLNSYDSRYQLALFLKYLCEQQSARVNIADEPTIGAEAYYTLFEVFDQKGWETPAVEDAVAQLPWNQAFFRFDYLDAARLDLVSSETLLGNFWLALYLKNLGVNNPDRRFYLMENEDNVTWDEDWIGSNYVKKMGPVGLFSDNILNAGGTLALTFGQGYDAVKAFAAQHHKVSVATNVDTLRVDFVVADSLFTAPIIQIVLVEPNNVVRDIIRSDRLQWSRTIANERNGVKLDHILIVVAGTEPGGKFTLKVSEVKPAPDVMVTGWNSKAGTSYEIDSFRWAWTWISPDLWIDNDGDGQADSVIPLGVDNQLCIRLRNQGHADATGIEVEFWFQTATLFLHPQGWKPVLDSAGTPQKLKGLKLKAGATGQWSVNWFLEDSQVSGASVRAVVTVPNDPNRDNKRCTSSMGQFVRPFGDLNVERRFPVGYPLYTPINLGVIPRSFGRWHVSVADIMRAAAFNFEPGQTVLDSFRLRRREVQQYSDGNYSPSGSPSPEPVSSHEHEEGSWSKEGPDPFGHYPTDPDALPPGLARLPLVTLTHIVDGKTLGGFTWAIDEER